MAAIAPHTPPPSASYTVPKIGDRYILFMGRAADSGGREVTMKSFPEGKWMEATKEAWTHHERGYPHMSLIDLGDNMRVLESHHVTSADGVWDW